MSAPRDSFTAMITFVSGLANTWLPLKKLYNKYENICSRADFFALACTVTSDYAAERGEQEGRK